MQSSFWLKSGCQAHYRVELSGQKVITQSHFLTTINTNIESNLVGIYIHQQSSPYRHVKRQDSLARAGRCDVWRIVRSRQKENVIILAKVSK